MSQKNNMLNAIKYEIKENLSLSIPLTAAQLIYSCSGFIGTALIAHLGEDALAASVLVSTIWMSLSMMFFGMLNSISVLIAHQYGARNKQAISEIMGQSFILGALVCVPIILTLLSTPLIFRYTDQPAAVLNIATEYMYALILTIPGLIVLVVIEQFLSGINRAKFVLRISFIVVPIEIALIYVLIFGKFGFPACGVAGIGYGFAITYTLTAIGLIWYLAKSKHYSHFNIYEGITTFKFKYIKELVKIGLPMGLMGMIEVSTFAVMTLWIAKFGTTILAAHQIAMQYLGFFITFIFAMSQAVTVRVGYEVGRQNVPGIYYALYIGLFLNTICMIVVAIAYFIFPNVFLYLDVNVHDPLNTRLVQDATNLLIISGILMIFDNFRIIGFGALRGLKDTKFPMYISFLTFWVIGLTLAYFFGFYLKFNGLGIWLGITLGIASGAVLVLWRLFKILQPLDLQKLIDISKAP